MAINWKPIPKVAYAAVIGPIGTTLATWPSTGKLDWKVPVAALLTAVVAYLVPTTGVTGKRSPVSHTD